MKETNKGGPGNQVMEEESGHSDLEPGTWNLTLLLHWLFCFQVLIGKGEKAQGSVLENPERIP